MADIPWTADQLTEGIANALAARDFEAVEDFLRLLAVVDPEQAQSVMNTMKFGMALSESRGLGEAIGRMSRA